MTEEVINGVKTIWHSDKEKTLQNIANLLFKFLWENEVKRLDEERKNKQEAA